MKATRFPARDVHAPPISPSMCPSTPKKQNEGMKGEKMATKSMAPNSKTQRFKPKSPYPRVTPYQNMQLPSCTMPKNEIERKKGEPTQKAKMNDENPANERKLKESETKQETHPIRNGRMMGR
jgi:hypothetical protein